MKTVEKLIGLNFADINTLLPNLKAATTRITKDYEQTTHPKLKMLDALIIFSLLSFVIQLAYANGLVFSRDPFNSYLAGVFCSLGQFALAGKYIILSRSLFTLQSFVTSTNNGISNI